MSYIIITLLTFISPLIYGYYYGVIDHHHYLPYLNKLVDSSLYLKDYYFSQPHNTYSIFNYFIVFITNFFHLSLAWTHLIYYCISLWLLYFSIYYLSQTLYKKKLVSFLAVVFFILPKWAAQIGYMTHHFYFVSRDLSLGLSLLALSFILLNKKIYSLLVLILAVLVNPSIPIPVFIFWFYRYFLQTKIFPGFIGLNPSWVNTIRQRGTYSFPHLWNWTGWGNLVLFLSLLGSSYLYFKNKLFGKYQKQLKTFIIICLFLFLFHSLIALIYPHPLIIQLQLLRSINLVFIISLISFSYLIYTIFNTRYLVHQLTTILALVGVFLWEDHLTIYHFTLIWGLPASLFLLKKDFIKLKLKPVYLKYFIIVTLIAFSSYKLLIIKPQIKLPLYFHYPNALIKDLSQYKTWLDLQLWVKNNTDKTAIFLTPPTIAGFRDFSQRGIVGDLKDGGVSFYSADYANIWQEKMIDLTDFNQLSTQDFLSLQSKYNFNYLVVTQEHQLLDYILIYQNQDYRLYQL
ncbi:MAG: DUF6798 domain-containing protein [Candidatus Beckwithbacteria bacterium]